MIDGVVTQTCVVVGMFCMVFLCIIGDLAVGKPSGNGGQRFWQRPVFDIQPN
jgi:hypothetical protein